MFDAWAKIVLKNFHCMYAENATVSLQAKIRIIKTENRFWRI